MEKIDRLYESPVCTCTLVEILVCQNSTYGDYLDYTPDKIVTQGEEDGWEF